MIEIFYVCVLPIFGDIELTIVGYKHIKVREGKLLIIPARRAPTATALATREDEKCKTMKVHSLCELSLMSTTNYVSCYAST